MNMTIPMLVVSTVIAGLAPRSMVQEPSRLKVSSRRPVDVSVEGLEEAARRPRGDSTRGGSIGSSARRSPGGLDTPLDCLESIADQATGSCLTASSTPTLGMLYPYPGLNNAFIPRAFVGGGENNQATERWSTVAGGYNNTASGYPSGYATVGGGQDNRATGPWSTVGGGRDNVASGYVLGLLLGSASVGGGVSNTASGNGATVAGGAVNTASGSGATVGGGGGNTASGQDATIGGGFINSAGKSATVAGGFANSAAGPYSTVGGGLSNSANGTASVVAGGSNNFALGNHSFAAGRKARAEHGGSFVWGDSKGPDKTSSAADEFNVYASGGVRMFTNSAATTGVLLAPGGSTWTMVSDRDAKENIEPVDARAILDKVAALPVATWNYKDQDDSIRHMGPMAQDFHAAFGLGLGDKTIDTIDPNGVALAAIRGLNELVRDETADLRKRLAEKDAEIEALLGRLERLEALMRR